jgi:nucleoid-associated protein YgaU
MVANNHDGRGRFATGNKAATAGGNPFAAAMAKLRGKLLSAITEGDVDAAIATLREVMASGKPFERIAAARELLDRAVGKPLATIEAELTAVQGGAGKIDYAYATPEEMAVLRRIQADLIARQVAQESSDDGRN